MYLTLKPITNSRSEINNFKIKRKQAKNAISDETRHV